MTYVIAEPCIDLINYAFAEGKAAINALVDAYKGSSEEEAA